MSPVFYARYDDLVETLKDKYGEYLPKSQWQLKCGFVNEVNAEVWRGNNQENAMLDDQQDNIMEQSEYLKDKIQEQSNDELEV